MELPIEILKVKDIIIEAKIIRADGTVEEKGVIARMRDGTVHYELAPDGE